MAYFQSVLFKFVQHFHDIHISPVRFLSLFEFRSKEILQKYDVNIQRFIVVDDLKKAPQLLQTFKADEYVIKAQILAGGRGLGHFDNGFKGGVQLTKDDRQITPILERMLGHRLITKQTPKGGILVSEVMVAESIDISKETYFCILMDRSYNGPVIIASPVGGTDIEDVAAKTPDLIRTIPVDIFNGVTDSIANEVALFLDFPTHLIPEVAKVIKNLWKVFIETDAIQVEINPLVKSTDERVIALDAKIQCDDNASFRQIDIFERHNFNETDPKELEASQYKLNYIRMDGNIGCLVNGAGLAMATMDIIKLNGGEPANFLDVGGGVNENQVYHAFRILLQDSNVKSILVNVFGGIVNCGTIARGIINASKSLNLTIPLTVRLEGTNVKEGKDLLENSALPIKFANNLNEAAQTAVQSLL